MLQSTLLHIYFVIALLGIIYFLSNAFIQSFHIILRTKKHTFIPNTMFFRTFAVQIALQMVTAVSENVNCWCSQKKTLVRRVSARRGANWTKKVRKNTFKKKNICFFVRGMVWND